MDQGSLLIVDDDADLLFVLGSRFQALGYRVVTASDGGAGLRVFEQERPDVVLLDIHMPEVDGLLTLRELRAMEPRARVIVISGDAGAKLARLMVEEGACDFLVKPLDMAAVETSVSVNMMMAAPEKTPNPGKT